MFRRLVSLGLATALRYVLLLCGLPTVFAVSYTFADKAVRVYSTEQSMATRHQSQEATQKLHHFAP